MTEPLRLSIVTVSFNSAATIADTLESVAAQRYPHVEHIVVDGASTDGTQDIVRRHSRRIARFVSEPDRGVYDAMNKGIALATGDVVAFLNSDDVYAHPDVLGRVADTMADPAIDACYADLVYVDDLASDRIVRDWRSTDHRPGLCLTGWMPAHPTFFARRDVYRRFGGFDLEFRLQADYELMVRLFETHGLRSRHVPERWVRMRTGGMSNSSWRNVARGNLEAYRACRKNGFAVTPFFIVRKLASRLPQFVAARLRR
jgi:glycosyltransferase involved in cell wall biosynthesis